MSRSMNTCSCACARWSPLGRAHDVDRGHPARRGSGGAQLQRVSEESLCSATGLPLIFAHARILTADGQLFEERAGAFYAVLHNRAEVVAHLRGGATWSSYNAQLKPYMLSAQIEWPDFTDDLL